MGTERVRLGTIRGFDTERARLGTFRGFGQCFSPVTPILPETHVFSSFDMGTFDVSRAVFRKLSRASEEFSRPSIPKKSRALSIVHGHFVEKFCHGHF